MAIGVMIVNSLITAFFFSFITFKFMHPNRFGKLAFFTIIFGIELIFYLFLINNAFARMIGGFIQTAFVVVITLFLIANQKRFLISANIALSIGIIYNVITHMTGGIIFLVFPIIFSLEGIPYNIIMQACLIIFAVLLARLNSKFFTQASDVKILQFSLVLKALLFIIMRFILPVMFDNSVYIFFMTFLFTVIMVIGYFFATYNSKLILELEKENKRIAVEITKRYVEAENVNRRYEEIVKFKHYTTKLIRSILGYINDNDIRGLKEYYNNHIAPVSETLDKELGDYEQINFIKVSLLKARLIELINTVSLMPNVNLFIQVDNVIDNPILSDDDLFKVVNIFIDNAVEETSAQEKGKIKIQISQEHDEFNFSVENTLVDAKSTPKPQNTGKGFEMIKEICTRYPGMDFSHGIKFSQYKQLIEVWID